MLSDGGYLADPLSLAQRLMEKLQVNLNDDYGIPSSQSDMYPSNIDVVTCRQHPFSQPDPHFRSGPVPQYQQHNGRQAYVSSSQPVNIGRLELSETDYSQLSEEPSMSQFTAHPHLPDSLVHFLLDIADFYFRRSVHPDSKICVHPTG
jgi:hypothetical protein